MTGGHQTLPLTGQSHPHKAVTDSHTLWVTGCIVVYATQTTPLSSCKKKIKVTVWQQLSEKNP